MPTRAQAEEILVGPAPTAGAGLVGGALASAGFVATGATPVAALSPAISQALMACGVTPDDVAVPDDDDFARLSAANWPKFLDIAALLLLESASFSFAGRVKTIKWEDYSKEVFGPADFNALIESRRLYVRRRWGWGAGSLTAGWVDYGFAQKDPTQTDLLWPGS